MKLSKFQKGSIALIFLFVMLILPFQNCSGGFQTADQSTSQAGLSSTAPPGSKSLNATIAWDKSSSANVQGYRIYVGTQSGNYDQKIDAGATTNPAQPQFQVTGLSSGTNYYAVVKAYDSAGEESIASNEIQIPGK